MATSGSIDFSVSRDNLLTMAHQHIGVVEEGGTLSSAQTTEAARLLNTIVKLRQADGMPLWALRSGYILPQTGTSTVNLNSTSGGHATLSYTQTTLAAAASSGQGTITVSSALGFGATYHVGIALDDATMHWTTQSGAAAGTVITLTTPLAGDAAQGAFVYVYQTKLQRPLRVLEAYVIDLQGMSRYPINIRTRDQFKTLGGFTSASVPNQVYYDPQLDTGILHLYPRFRGGTEIVEIVFHRTFEDFDATGDTPDFPQEWYLPLMLELASLLGPKYGIPLAERNQLMKEAEFYRQVALSAGYPEGSLYFQVDAH